MRLGILQRYVIRQLATSFLMALIAITTIFVLFTVMAEATRAGLSPHEILRVTPFIVPGSLPYTVPVALLFAVSVVFGRMAGDNEIIAMKTAGLSAMIVLGPALAVGLALSGALVVGSSELIPRANHEFKRLIFNDFEDLFYKQLKKDGQFDQARWPFFFQVKDVQDRTLVGATFKHRAPGRPDEFDMTLQARRARIRFDLDAKKVRVFLEDAETEGGADNPFVVLIDGEQCLEYEMPDGTATTLEKKIQEMTNRELLRNELAMLDKMKSERARKAVETALRVAAGRLARPDYAFFGSWQTTGVDWPGVREAFVQHKWWESKKHEYETERHQRLALAFGPLFFVLLGAPVGILFARRDYLSAFISCFLPIIIVYYPLLLGAINMSKQGIAWPEVVWSSNGVLLVLAMLFAIPPVMKH